MQNLIGARHSRAGFCTVLRSVKSPTNVGMIVRSHVAFSGKEIVFVGYEHPWLFKKGSQAFSRKLERRCELVSLKSDEAFFEWAMAKGYVTVALEISEASTPIERLCFRDTSALVLGSESVGLPDSFVSSCDHVVRIPQYGAVGSLNVAVAASIAMYEFSRGSLGELPIDGFKYRGEHEDR